MRRFICFMLCITMCLSLFACTQPVTPVPDPGGGTEQPEQPDGGTEQPEQPGGGTEQPSEYTQVIADPLFKKGFNLMGNNSSVHGTTVLKKIKYGSVLGNPQWQMAQWWSKNNLAEGKEVSTASSIHLLICLSRLWWIYLLMELH